MKYPVTIALVVAGATALALAEPTPSQHPRVGQLVELKFAPGSAELAVEVDARLLDKLDEALTWAHDHPDGLLVLDGHADPPGGRAANVQLSLERAKAVRERLVAAGGNPEQIVVAAFGENGPRRDRSVVIWGTRAGMGAVVTRTLDNDAQILSGGNREIATR